MAKPLRVLIVEDSEDDALLVIRELQHGGYDTTFERVETAEAMTAALEKQAWDIIIADYSLPHFSAPEALELFHQSGLDLPFIVISGAIGEETAVATMKAGAHDYLMKGNLTRLVPSIERELREVEVRKERKQAEEETMKFKTISDRAGYGASIASLEGKFIYINKSYAEMHGYPPSELIGEYFSILYPEDQLEILNKSRNRLLKTGVYFAQELWHKRRDGTIFPTVTTAGLIRDDEGRPQHIYSMAIDITERKQAEVQIKQLQEYLQLQIERMPIGLIVWDTEFRVQSWNPAAEKIFGFTAKEALGKHPYDFIVPKEAQPQVDNIWRRLLNGDLTAYSINENITKDGRTIICNWANTPLKEANDTVTGVLAMVQDITEQKRAEEDIKRAAEEWRATFDSIADFVSICDEDFRFIRVNKALADILKKKPVELIGKPCYEMVHGTNEPIPLCPHKKTVKTKKPAMAEFFEPHLDIHLEVMTSPIFNEKGEVVACVHVARDITERKKMEEQLIVTDRLASIGELVSGIAHEINNPLTGVIGFSDLLLEREVADDIKEDLEVINREAKRTAGIVSNLLIFARKHPDEKQPADINNIIQEILKVRAYEQKVHNVEVNTRLAPDLPEIMANSFQLQQVFINIIINAEHFMTEAHRRGTLTITTERIEDIIRASFADDGPGIAEKNLGHLFDPFFTTKEVGKGTGLGLSISHGIVTEHGGRIYAESKPGKGATFVVELPIRPVATGKEL